MLFNILFFIFLNLIDFYLIIPYLYLLGVIDVDLHPSRQPCLHPSEQPKIQGVRLEALHTAEPALAELYVAYNMLKSSPPKIFFTSSLESSLLL
jgi:hypothetical protein